MEVDALNDENGKELAENLEDSSLKDIIDLMGPLESNGVNIADDLLDLSSHRLFIQQRHKEITTTAQTTVVTASIPTPITAKVKDNKTGTSSPKILMYEDISEPGTPTWDELLSFTARLTVCNNKLRIEPCHE